MPRYVAFLRGVSPMNARMPELQRCFESAGFTNVRTLLSSGNVVFDARAAREEALERRAERAMEAMLGHAFGTFVRPVAHLQALLDADHFAEFALAGEAKRVVTFLRAPMAPRDDQPREREGARLLKVVGREAFTAYVPGAKTPVFMQIIERHFGSDVTTRTLDTVRKCTQA